LIFIPYCATAYSLTASANKIIYSINDPITITGIVDAIDSIQITATIYNMTGDTLDTLTTMSSGGTSNSFSLSGTIDSSYIPGNYMVLVTDGMDTINMSFKVVPESIIIKAYPINSGDDIINVSTSLIIQTGQENALNGNFTELLNLSKSTPQKIHYGNYSIENKIYHFVLVDQTSEGNYDRLYIDDDKDFRLLNDTEDNETDVEYQELKRGSVFSNTTFKYIIGEIERTTGDKIILWTPPIGKPPYSVSDDMNLIIITKNTTHLISKDVDLDILNTTYSNITSTEEISTNEFGWKNITINLTDIGTSGQYLVSLDDKVGLMPFQIETLKLFVSVNDISNIPTSKFTPGSKIRIVLASKDSTGPKNMTSFTVTVYKPSGSTETLTEDNFTYVSDGIYRYDLDTSTYTNGKYNINVVGVVDSDSQQRSTSFEIQSVNFETEAVNTKYIDEADNPEAMVNAFAPNTNVTIMTFLSDITSGGLSKKGPEGFTGLLTPDDCNSSLTLLELRDENDDSYSVSYRSMNLSDAVGYLPSGTFPEHIPPDFLSQCMLIFETPSKNGIYKAQLKMKYQEQEYYSRVSFGVQKLWVESESVDFKGEEYGFFAPNSTVRIKLKITDLRTDEELPSTNLTSAKIIKLERVFPSYTDVLANSTIRYSLDENITNGMISFTSPPDEGFYMMKFRFSAYVHGEVETGIGEASFMLKKYMIWGQLYGNEQGQWFVKQKQNITLSVSVLDVDKTQTYIGGYNTQLTCTDCGGFVVNVSEIRNDQQFKTVSGYTIEAGTIVNSSNPTVNVTIVPTADTDMQSGWYSVDLVVTDPNTGNTYFGWGWFEIRNFWVDVQPLEFNGSHYILEQGGYKGREGRETYGVGQTINFTVIPRVPFSPEILQQTQQPFVDVEWIGGEFSVPVTGYNIKITSTSILVCYEFGGCQPIDTYVITLSDLPSDKQGDYQVNVKVTTNQGSDIGTMWFDISSYLIETEYRINSWPPLFSSSENFTVNFTGLNFDEPLEHNLKNVTVEDFINIRQGKFIKVRYGENYTVNCADNICQVNVNLTYLPTGEYVLRFSIIDNENNQKSEEVFFRIQNEIVSIPSIEQAWIWDYDTVSKKIDENIRDMSNCEGGPEARNSIPDAALLCGDFVEPCEGVCESRMFNFTVPNTTYTRELFGYISMMSPWQTKRYGELAEKDPMFMYSNGTHLWINATPKNFCENCEYWKDLRETTPVAINGTFNDSANGMWRLDAITDQSIVISGINTIYNTGVLINTTYSKSGIIKLGQIEERNLGAKTQTGRKGLDLNNDGFTNGTAYFAISDSVTPGVYDTFFFSTNGDFTTPPNPIFVNALDRTQREFGSSPLPDQELTLLSIDPRAQTVLFYSKQIGDWAQLGDVKWNSNITIPVLVVSPDGSGVQADVSVVGYKNLRNWKLNQTILATKNINKIGELRFNSSVLGETGEYSFAIKTTDLIEEWKWPIVTVRKYLVDAEIGEALYVNFKQLPVNEYKLRPARIYQDARNNTPGFIINGVLYTLSQTSPEECSVFNATHNITEEILPNQPSIYAFFKDFGPSNNGFFFYNSTSGVLYRNITGCWFNLSASQLTYHKDSSIMINYEDKTYNTTILTIGKDLNKVEPWDVDFDFTEAQPCHNFNNVPVVGVTEVSNSSGPLPPNVYNWTQTTVCINATEYLGHVYTVFYEWLRTDWRLDFGISGVDPSVIKPMSMNTNDNWGVQWGYLQNVNIFGTNYDLILANHSDIQNPACYLQPSMEQCVSSLWLVPRINGNFSTPSTKNVTVGRNFTKDLYLASVGPNDGNGIVIGNFSLLPNLGEMKGPAFGGMPIADGTPAYFAILDEASLNYDLDKDSNKDKTFYMILFDSDFNYQSSVTANLVDDDLESLPWILKVNTQNGAADFSIDYTHEENDMNETWGNLPKGIWKGNARFGNQIQGVKWEYQPNWDIPFINNTHLILEKQKWEVNQNQPVDVLIKVSNFDQSPIVNANVTITKISRASSAGFQPFSDYQVNTMYNTTNMGGFAILKITPNSGTWLPGQYQLIINIQTKQGNENVERWFCVGSCGW